MSPTKARSNRRGLGSSGVMRGDHATILNCLKHAYAHGFMNASGIGSRVIRWPRPGDGSGQKPQLGGANNSLTQPIAP